MSLDGYIIGPLGDLCHLLHDGVEPLDVAHSHDQLFALDESSGAAAPSSTVKVMGFSIRQFMPASMTFLAVSKWYLVGTQMLTASTLSK